MFLNNQIDGSKMNVVYWRLWFHGDPLRSTESFHYTKGSLYYYNSLHTHTNGSLINCSLNGSLVLTVLHCLLRWAAGFSISSLLQWRRQRSGSNQFLRFVSSSVCSVCRNSFAKHMATTNNLMHYPAFDMPAPSSLPYLGMNVNMASPLGIPAVSALLPDPVPGPADVEQPSAAGLRCSTGPQQQNHKHREPASEGQAACCITRLGHASKLTTDSCKSMHFCVDVLWSH